MSYEAEQDMQDGEGAEGAENADDLTMALAGGETSFVSEGKQPVSKGTMVVAGLLLACGAVTYFMYVRTGPAEATASPESAKNDSIVKGFIDDPARAQGWVELMNSTEKVVKQFKADVVQVPLAALAGNPFEKVKQKPGEDEEALRKKQDIEKLKTAAKEAVGELKLQTIIHRDPKKAAVMINNSMYRKGQKITVAEGKVTFTVDEIRPDAVSIVTPIAGEAEPLKFELKMKH